MRGDVDRAKDSKNTLPTRKLCRTAEPGMQSRSYLFGNIINGLYSLIIFETLGI